MAKITYHYKTKKGFAKPSRAYYLKVNGKKFLLPKDKNNRAKIIDRAKKRASKKSFSDKIKEQGLRVASSPPTQARYFSESKTLNIPNSTKTFETQKFYYEPNEHLNFNLKNVRKIVKNLKNKSYPKFLETYDEVKFSKVYRDKKAKRWPHYLFRIDTAYVDKAENFSKTDGIYKKGRDGLSDGRGFSLGRRLNVNKKSEFIEYLNNTFEGFIASLLTYLGRQGISHGQINALILEVS